MSTNTPASTDESEDWDMSGFVNLSESWSGWGQLFKKDPLVPVNPETLFRLGDLTPVVLRHLAFVCDGRTLKALASVNKKFRHICEPALFRDIVVREIMGRSRRLALSVILEPVGTNLRIHKYARFTNLTVLNFRIPNPLKDTSIGPAMSQAATYFPIMPNLKALGVYSNADPKAKVSFPNVLTLLDKCPNLVALKLDITWSNTAILPFGGTPLSGNALLYRARLANTSLMFLHLVPRKGDNDWADYWDSANLQSLNTMFPSLEGLALGGGYRDYHYLKDLTDDFKGFRNLKDLVLCDQNPHPERRATGTKPKEDRTTVATALFDAMPRLERLSLYCNAIASATSFKRASSHVLITGSCTDEEYTWRPTSRSAGLAESSLIRTWEEDEWLRVVRMYL